MITHQRATDVITAYAIATGTVNLLAALGVLASLGVDVPTDALGDSLAAIVVQIVFALPVLLWQLGTPTPITAIIVMPAIVAAMSVAYPSLLRRFRAFLLLRK